MTRPTLTEINLDQKARVLALDYDDGQHYELSCEYLRVYSPSAEVKGHGPGQEVLQTGKEQVGIADIEPVGNYAIKLVFDDGHNTGLYSWDYLYELCTGMEEYWQGYLQALADAGYQRKEL